MVKLVNRAKMSTATTGTGTITLGSAVDGFQTFAAAGVANADTVRYAIEDGFAWEIGTGTYTATGTTLTRTVIESSNSDAPINLSGNALVFLTVAGGDLQHAADMNQGVATTDSPSFAGLMATTADINGGTIDNTVIGGFTPAAIRGTTGSFSGDVSIADKIVHTGDTNTAIRFPSNGAVTVETNGAERMRITSTGSVGIGTSTPLAKLDVNETAPIFGSGRGTNSDKFWRPRVPTYAGTNTGSDWFSPIFAASLNDQNILYVGGGTSTAYAATEIQFRTAPNATTAAGSTQMFISGDGKVGIGSNRPTGLLTIGSSVPRVDFLESDGSAGFDNTILIREADVFSIQTRNGGAFVSNDYRMTANASGALTHEWRTANTERMRITSAGNVGIGTSSPAQMLDVVGQIKASNTITREGSGVVSFIASRNNSTVNSFYEARTTAGSVFFGTNDGANFVVGPVSSGSGNFMQVTPTLFNVATSGTERLRIDSSGNVGIGTSSPTNLLDVNGNSIRVRTAQTPASASDTGNQGQIAWDANYIYVCVATNTWKRVAIATW